MKTQNPWMGRAKKSAGNMTACKMYDSNVLRAKAFEVSNPKTPAQQVQRKYFALLALLVNSFSPEQLRTLFPSKPKKFSRRSALAKQLAEDKTMSGDERVIDYAHIDTLGNAPVMDFGTTTVTKTASTVTVALDQSVKSNTSLENFDFIAALVNVTKGSISLTTECVDVSTGSLELTMPQGWESTDTINAIPLVCNSTDGKIALVGFGTMGVVKRPARAIAG